MKSLEVLGVLVIALTPASAVTSQTSSANSQPSAPSNHSLKTRISVVLKNASLKVGERPLVVFTMTNTGSQTIGLPIARFWYTVHVRSTHGEPTLTMMHRHQRGDYRPGDTTEGEGGGVTLGVEPGKSEFLVFDLSHYYDLSVPGSYCVYIEYLDYSGTILRSNTAQFEIKRSL